MSSARKHTDHATIVNYTVAAGQTTTLGRLVLLASDTTVQTAGQVDTAVGVALSSETAGNPVDVYLFGPVVPMVVGTGGATRSTVLEAVADGVADAPAHDSSGASNDIIIGMAMETGVATNRIGVMLCRGNRGSA